MAERVQVRELGDDDGQRLLRILRRGSGSVVTWRRAQMLLLSAQGMPVRQIAEVTFTSPDRGRDVIHNFNTDGFTSIYPRYRGGRPPTFTLANASKSSSSHCPARRTMTCRFRPGAWPNWPTSWSLRGGRGHQP